MEIVCGMGKEMSAQINIVWYVFHYRQLNEMGVNAVCGCNVLFSDSEVVNVYHFHSFFTWSLPYDFLFAEVSVFFSVTYVFAIFLVIMTNIMDKN